MAFVCLGAKYKPSVVTGPSVVCYWGVWPGIISIFDRMRYSLLPILLFFLCLSCNKDTSTPSQSSGSGASAAGFSLEKCYGQITFDDYIQIGAGNSGLYRIALNAKFTDVPMSKPVTNNINVGPVTVNGKVLKLNNGPLGSKFYSDTTGTLFSVADFALSAPGNSLSPAINFHYQSGSPALTDTSGIPNTYSQAAGIHLLLKGIVDADSLVFTLTRQNYYQVKRQVATSAQDQVKIDIDRTELSTLMENNMDADLSIVVFRKKLLRSGARDYFVFSRKTYSKHVYISLF